jgi:RecA-family ATPase
LRAAIEADKKRPHFERIGGAAIVPTNWIVKGFLESGALGMVFGDSGTYKSFLSVDLAASIATGTPFFGMKTKRGAVYYIAAEGQGGIIRRFRGWAQERGILINDAPLYRYTGGVDLISSADVLSTALDEAIEEETEPPALAIIDTWARAIGGDDSDTNTAAEGLSKVDAIRARFPEMAVLLVHHTGHANKERARGASLLHAAMDSEFRLEIDKERNIVLTNTKAKETEPLPPYGVPRPRGEAACRWRWVHPERGRGTGDKRGTGEGGL